MLAAANSSALMLLILDSVMKGAIVLLLAAGLNSVLRHSSASLRHLVWSLAVVAVLMIPVLSIALPHWPVPGVAPLVTPAGPEGSLKTVKKSGQPCDESTVAPPATAEPPAETPEPSTEPPEPSRKRPRPSRRPVSIAFSGHLAVAGESESASPDVVAVGSTSDIEGGSAPGASVTTGDGASEWPRWLVLAWLLGALVFAGNTAAGLLRTWIIARRARRLTDGRLASTLARLSAELGVTRRLELLECSGRCMPMTWGIVRPKIVLPADAHTWPEGRLRAVLLHELAHIKRLDYLTQLLAELACVLHWMNPFVWVAARLLRVERELACDDQVLRAGSRASDYAEHLLDVARTLRTSSARPLLAVPMARPSNLSGRLRAVLDGGRARRAPSRRTVLLASLAAGIVIVPIATATPEAVDDPSSRSAASGLEATGIVSVGERPATLAVEPGTRKTVESAMTETRPVTVVSEGRGRDGTRAKAWRLDEASPGVGYPLAGPKPYAWANPAEANPAESWPSVRVALPAEQSRCDWTARHGRSSASINVDDDTYRMRMSREDCELNVDLSGELVFNDDETDIVTIRGGRGEFEIEEEVGRDSRRLVLERDGDGLRRAWYVNRDEQPFDSEARAWLSDMILVLFRRAGYQAEERAARILARGGPDAVLQEIRQIPSDYTAGEYYRVLLSQAELDPATLRRLVREAAQTIDSDYTLAQLLVAVAENQPVDESVQVAYAEAAGSIDSDYERARVLSAIFARENLSPDVARAMLQAASGLDSDYELARLLVELLQSGSLHPAMTNDFFQAVRSIDSDYEQRRVLAVALNEVEASQEFLDQALETAGDLDSDYELSQLLMSVADAYPSDAPLPESYLRAAGSIESDYELGRVLRKLTSRDDLSSGSLIPLLELAQSIGSDHELSGLLQAVVRDHRLDDRSRPAFFGAVENIDSSYERGRLLGEVVRSQPVDDVLAEAVLVSARGIESDHELAGLLIQLTDRITIDDGLRPAFMRTVETISSKYERDRVLAAAFEATR